MHLFDIIRRTDSAFRKNLFFGLKMRLRLTGKVE